MQLPRGTLASSYRGPTALKNLNESIARDSLTGYLRASAFSKETVSECVIVYKSGKPAMSFVSDGAVDHKDDDFHMIEGVLKMEGSIVEVCKLADRQVDLLLELYGEFAIVSKPLPVAPLPVAKHIVQETTRPMPGAIPKARPRSLLREKMPDIRGRFIRSEQAGSVSEYMQRHPGETGHLLVTGLREGKHEECHVILINGRIEIAYNDSTVGPELAEGFSDGNVEFYVLDETVLASVLGKHARKESDFTRIEPLTGAERPALGIPARELLEKSAAMSIPMKDDINRAVDEISVAMEDDVAMMRRVERDFANHVDELLNKLELSHLKSLGPRRKR